ncbi:MAG: hypothetical protein AVDCRST_MAG37-2262 [uncultured Rubrobacteraceae bacterium]|uniref:Uncharacterized protein n=1 Tax=uncultured Rubrobacteraceae bacterium TaxID=349277 RepID=A0A6J4QP75_9ACTN|nr:MAG: hypothetical protein AVDCRST_MAG37-2262 [uncultured Rubrobacteraceae bacterium]
MNELRRAEFRESAGGRCFEKNSAYAWQRRAEPGAFGEGG